MNIYFLSFLPTLLLGTFFYSNNWHLISFDWELPLLLFSCFVLNLIWNKIWIYKSKLALAIPMGVILAQVIGIAFLGQHTLVYYIPIIILLSAVLVFIIFLDNDFRITKIFLTALIAVNIINIFTKVYFGNEQNNNVLNIYENMEVTYKLKKKYNVYYLVADTYPSQKSAQIDNIDISNILEWLKKRKFSINDNAYSNYPSTTTSMTATFNMSLHEDFGSNYVKGSGSIIKKGKNLVVKTFLANGYNINIRGISFNNIETADTNIYNIKTDLEYFIRYVRPLAIAQAMYENYFYKKKAQIEHFYSRVSKNKLWDMPKFTYLHSNQAHSHSFGCITNSDNFYNSIGFKQQLDCVDVDIKKVVTYIEEKDPNAIIILQSDHGSRASYRFSNENYNDRITKMFGILFAVKWPKECSYLGDEVYSPVNLFPRVFSCLSGEKPNYGGMDPDDSFGMSGLIFHKSSRGEDKIRVIKDNKIIAPEPVQ